jgi:FAD:protein FMN transferase
VPAHAFEVIEAAVELYRRSSGVFDIAVAPALQALGLLPRGETDNARPRRRAAQRQAGAELLSL